MKRGVRSVLVALALALTAAPGGACPSCPVGRAARQEVLDRDFGANLSYALAPFLALGAIARWAERRRGA